MTCASRYHMSRVPTELSRPILYWAAVRANRGREKIETLAALSASKK